MCRIITYYVYTNEKYSKFGPILFWFQDFTRENNLYSTNPNRKEKKNVHPSPTNIIYHYDISLKIHLCTIILSRRAF